jgi:hypothetical protein
MVAPLAAHGGCSSSAWAAPVESAGLTQIP